MGVEDYVDEFRSELAVIPAHEVLPLLDVETVVEHHSLVDRQRAFVDVTQTVVGGDVEVLEPVEFDRTGAFGKFRIDRFVAFGHIHHRPGGGGVRLVDDLNAHQRLAMAVPLGEAFKHGQHEFDLVGQLRPFAHTGDAAVVETVLAHRRGMQVDENGQAVFLGPVEGFVEFVDAADERRAVTEDEVWHGDAHGVQTPRFDGGEIAFIDVFGTVGLDARLVDSRVELCGQVVFVVRGGTVEQRRVHPLLQHQPVAEVHTFDVVEIHMRSFVRCGFHYSITP